MLIVITDIILHSINRLSLISADINALAAVKLEAVYTWSTAVVDQGACTVDATWTTAYIWKKS